jgi:hypothetical protein
MRIIKPILDGKAAVCSVRPEAEANYVRDLHAGLGDRVWETGCSSWYLNRVDGKSWNAMTYPFTQFHFWYRSAFPVWQDWEFTVR